MSDTNTNKGIFSSIYGYMSTHIGLIIILIIILFIIYAIVYASWCNSSDTVCGAAKSAFGGFLNTLAELFNHWWLLPIAIGAFLLLPILTGLSFGAGKYICNKINETKQNKDAIDNAVDPQTGEKITDQNIKDAGVAKKFASDIAKGTMTSEIPPDAAKIIQNTIQSGIDAKRSQYISDHDGDDKAGDDFDRLSDIIAKGA